MDVENTALCGVYVPCILRIYLCRSLCTLYIEDIPLGEFMYLVYMEHVPLVEFMYLVY